MRSALILVVEDHPINRRLLQAQLAAEGWQSELVATGAEALLWLEHTRPIAVITDYVLEDMTGVELLHRVRRWETGSPGLPAIPMILYSGMPLDYLQNESRGLDCRAIITKPVGRAQLRQALAPLLSVPETPPSTSSVPDDLLIELLQFGNQQLPGLRLSLESRQFQEAAGIAHSLHGAAAVLKQTEIAQYAADIENQARQNPITSLDAAFGNLQTALDQLDRQIKARQGILST
ncbi:response regulator [Collimonas arenae]|uniref:Response regulator n=1 Tax=Collimonas arenae TaxID=279058 RepID=A0A127QFL0_9BURK|nr:response regulator [Collimonas arenae]AMO98872.1 response regulator [Collimonas arenae]AMP08766.1 response regulator [Collimonas arenae]